MLRGLATQSCGAAARRKSAASRVACPAFEAWRANVDPDASRPPSQPRAYDLVKCKSLWNTFKEVHVLVFGDDASGSGTHGVHSLWTCNGDRCYNTVVAFAQLEDAYKCAVPPPTFCN
jgi:hypothetical protein